MVELSSNCCYLCYSIIHLIKLTIKAVPKMRPKYLLIKCLISTKWIKVILSCYVTCYSRTYSIMHLLQCFEHSFMIRYTYIWFKSPNLLSFFSHRRVINRCEDTHQHAADNGGRKSAKLDETRLEIAGQM